MSKKLAVLYCLRTNSLCTGAGCMKAIRTRSHAFERYKDEDIDLMAFCSCNGCGDFKFKRKDGMEQKLERLQSIGTEVVHISTCAKFTDDDGKLCPQIVWAIARLEAMGIEVVMGTH